jgi:hypothetical protein
MERLSVGDDGQNDPSFRRPDQSGLFNRRGATGFTPAKMVRFRVVPIGVRAHKAGAICSSGGLS